MVDAVSGFMAFDAAVKRVDREIGLAVSAKAVAAALLAAQVARGYFAQAEDLGVELQHRFRVEGVVGDVANARKFFLFARRHAVTLVDTSPAGIPGRVN